MIKRIFANKPLFVAVIFELIVLAYYVALLFPKQPDITIYPQDFESRYSDSVELFDDGGIGIDTQGEFKGNLLSHRMNNAMVPGRYTVTVTYTSRYGSEYSHADFAGEVWLEKKGAVAGILSNEIKLRDDATVASDHIWLKSNTTFDEVDVFVKYHGNGLLSVNSITISENYIYRLIRLLAALLVITGINAFICFFTDEIRPFSPEQKLVGIGIAAAVAFSSALCFSGTLYMGHDSQFHLNRIVRLAEAIREGQIPHRIQLSWNNGYGYVSPLFYGELFLTIPAGMYILGAPLYLCYNTYVVLVNAAMCIVAYYNFYKMIKGRKLALLGAVLYTCSAYHMTNIYNRVAVGEYTAQIFLPLVIYGFYHLYAKADDEKFRWKDALPLIVGFSGIIQSHTLTLIMAAEFAVAFCLVSWRKTFRRRRIVALAQAALVTFALNAWFLIPFVDSMLGMDLRIEHLDYRLAGEAASLSQILGVLHPSEGAAVADGAYGELPIAIGFALVLTFGLAVICLIKKAKWKSGFEKEYKILSYSFCMGAVSIVLSSDVFPWDLVNRLPILGSLTSKVQFPWRYLVVATVMAVLAGIMAIRIIAENVSIKGAAWAMSLTLVILTMLSEGRYVSDLIHDAEPEQQITEHTVSYKSDLLYLPEGTLNSDVYYQRIVSCYGQSDILSVMYDKGVRSYTMANQAEAEDVFEVPVYMYENYHAYAAETGAELETYAGTYGYMAIKVPAQYNGTIIVKYVEPVLWRLTEVLSVLTVIGLTAAYLFDRKNERNSQSVIS